MEESVERKKFRSFREGKFVTHKEKKMSIISEISPLTINVKKQFRY